MCNFRLLRVSSLFEHQTYEVFDLKLLVGGGEHKVVLYKSGCRAYRGYVGWGLNFLSVIFAAWLGLLLRRRRI